MRQLIYPIVAVLDRVQRRFARSRSGSVLILTVVMVVLLALLGTALLSTTRVDRYTATQNTANTQIDLLVEGVKELAKSRIRSDLQGPAPTGSGVVIRPAVDTGAGTMTWGNFDAARVAANTVAYQNLTDQWLSMRTPSEVQQTPGAPVHVYWQSLGEWLAGTSFDAPAAFENNQGSLSTGTVSTLQDRVSSTFAKLFRPTRVTISGVEYPAFHYNSRFYLAADADGDGIADSGLFRLPVGQIDGVTYYAGVRILDNNSAINVNTAWSRAFDFLSTGATADAIGGTGGGTFADNLGWFRPHVGLHEALSRRGGGVTDLRMPLTPTNWVGEQNASAEILALNRYRFGYALTASGDATTFVASAEMLMDPQVDPNNNATPEPRGDATFLTQADALEHQLARRLRNPGYNILSTDNSRVQYRAFSITDSIALAYRFCMINPYGSPSPLEKTFHDAVSGTDPDSVYMSAPNYPGKNRTAGPANYSPRDVGKWYDDVVHADGQYRNSQVFVPGVSPAYTLDSTDRLKYATLRPYLTAWNPTSIAMPQRDLPGAATAINAGFESMPAFREGQAKANVNTATFGELWRAYWSAMAAGDGGSPFGPDTITGHADLYRGMEFDEESAATSSRPFMARGPEHPMRMFRNSLRNPFSGIASPTIEHILPQNQVLLRAAIAATQTEQIRRFGTATTGLDPIVRRIKLPIEGQGDCNVTIYGYEPQPFITEVYVNTDTTYVSPAGQNMVPYVAVELYNPHDQPIIVDFTEYEIVAVARPATGTYPLQAPTPIAVTGSYTIPGNGFLVLENLGSPGGVTYRPDSSGAVAASGANWVSGVPLEGALGNELVIRKRVSSTLTGAAAFRPIDSFDFTMIPPTAPGSNVAEVFHYARPCGATNSNRWRCVYPGRYYVGGNIRHQGTDYSQPWNPANGETDPWAATQGPPAAEARAQMTLGAENPVASWDPTGPSSLFTIQLPEPDRVSPSQLKGGGPNFFPFGQFAREGDMLQVPFIGAYVIENAAGGPIEMNAITMDASFAEDTDLTDDGVGYLETVQREQIGRFAPLRSPSAVAPFGTPNDYSANVGEYRYAWAKDLFEYLTVRAPQDDYLPDVQPDRLTVDAGGGTLPQKVDNDGDGQANDIVPMTQNLEDTEPEHGLININTAPWRVLAALPWMRAGDERTYTDAGAVWGPAGSGDGIEDSIQLAKAIVKWRDGDPGNGIPGNGPFLSIFDLYRVPAFRNLQDRILQDGEPGRANGDFTHIAAGATVDNARHDFEEQFQLLNRISSLITTHSDSFTVYIVVQGWRGVGTTKPEKVVERRAAFIQDRHTVTRGQTRLPAAANVPND